MWLHVSPSELLLQNERETNQNDGLFCRLNHTVLHTNKFEEKLYFNVVFEILGHVASSSYEKEH